VKSTPNARRLQGGRFMLLSASTLFPVTDEFIQLINLGFAMFTTASTQASDFIVAEFFI
jgi:hypothetical protein